MARIWKKLIRVSCQLVLINIGTDNFVLLEQMLDVCLCRGAMFSMTIARARVLSRSVWGTGSGFCAQKFND